MNHNICRTAWILPLELTFWGCCVSFCATCLHYIHPLELTFLGVDLFPSMQRVYTIFTRPTGQQRAVSTQATRDLQATTVVRTTTISTVTTPVSVTTTLKNCRSFCSRTKQGWSVKCKWEKFCGGCSECSESTF